ncbi:MAG: hypothetical protein ACI8RD_009524 [Bacillariaceae sp.]|jgi:hypothetical protein
MEDPMFFVDHLPTPPIFCPNIGVALQPGSHILFKDAMNEETHVGQLISYDVNDNNKALIYVYEYFQSWQEANTNIHKSPATKVNSVDMTELVATTINASKPIDTSAITDIAFVFQHDELIKYPALKGMDNIFFVRYNSDGSDNKTVLPFAKHYMDKFVKENEHCHQIVQDITADKLASVYSLTAASFIDYCQDVFTSLLSIKKKVSTILCRTSAEQGMDATMKDHVEGVPPHVFHYICRKSLKVSSANSNRLKYDIQLWNDLSYRKMKRKCPQQLISFIDNDDLDKLVKIFGKTILIGIRKGKPRVSDIDGKAVQPNDTFNITLPRSLSKGNYNGISFLYCEELRSLRIIVHYTTHQFFATPPPTDSGNADDQLWHRRHSWDFMSSVFNDTNLAGATVNEESDVAVARLIPGAFFDYNAIGYTIMRIDGDDVTCTTEIKKKLVERLLSANEINTNGEFYT